MSHSASDGIGNRLYLLIPLALSPLPLIISRPLSFHSSPYPSPAHPPFLNVSPNPILLSFRLPAFSLFPQMPSWYCPVSAPLVILFPPSFLFF